MATSAATWDEDFGPLIVKWWAIADRIAQVQAVKGWTNASVQTLATTILASQITNYSLPNTYIIAMAQGLSQNSFS